MPNDLSTWAAIALIAGVTLATRLAGSVLMSRVEPSPKIERFLDGLSVSVIAALVASFLAQNGFREAISVGLASLVMLRSKNAVWAMVTGMAIAAAWSVALHA
ncbi:hypothetical protein GCM10010869_04660 [Mesorhizobium tianshanense]|uniref:Branched-subunit amino acid transport protein AzlD n=1 Tax=Mesorhizobium tianshanense TaxID=39844 RepID=A0A562NBC1_9HYPH|nr:AzlD domain-containing protein [Mesorhizobium tianshanense]TWI29492.1 branched-subunit amino acid transport protein AzlD [Mesorhizobium tianshanense]GLS34878.1 hypothetical protein GCM10010869_04660 [Mesorhizobium tianshanense]